MVNYRTTKMVVVFSKREALVFVQCIILSLLPRAVGLLQLSFPTTANTLLQDRIN